MAASSTISSVPAWSTALLWAGAVVLAVGVVALFLVKDLRLERRIYWSTAVAGGLLGSLALLHRGWGVVVAAYAAILFATVFWAYFRTDYLKIGAKVYSASALLDRRKPRG